MNSKDNLVNFLREQIKIENKIVDSLNISLVEIGNPAVKGVLRGISLDSVKHAEMYASAIDLLISVPQALSQEHLDKQRELVEKHIRLGWSPELIAGRLSIEYPEESISHEAIYQWIYQDATHLIAFLVRAHRRRKHRGYSRKHKKSHIPERISIRERPAAVLKRRQIGHWEADTISCRKSYQAVQVSVERKARYAKLAKLKAKTSRAMSVALIRRLCRYPAKMRRSITYDNGPENAEHMRTNKVLGTASYFCEPFRSYERGTVENTIGLVRRFIPKKTNLAKVSQDHLTKIEYWLNNRPRKCLKFKTPAEVFKAECCT